jgi:hypothetical protein
VNLSLTTPEQDANGGPFSWRFFRGAARPCSAASTETLTDTAVASADVCERLGLLGGAQPCRGAYQMDEFTLSLFKIARASQGDSLVNHSPD